MQRGTRGEGREARDEREGEDEENRFEAYRAHEEFLAEHLGGRIEPGPRILPELYETGQ